MRFADANGRNPGVGIISFIPAIPIVAALAELAEAALVITSITAVVTGAGTLVTKAAESGFFDKTTTASLDPYAAYALNPSVLPGMNRLPNAGNGQVNAKGGQTSSGTSNSSAGNNRSNSGGAGNSTAGKTNSNIPAPGKGKGTVPPNQRDKKRVLTKSEKSDMLSNNGDKCDGCGSKLHVDDAKAHHVVRHADGGPTTKQNTAILCEGCHTQIHK